MSGASIGRLSESLDGVARNTSRILDRLQSFESKLTVIDAYISTMREETLLPSQAKRNVDVTLMEVDRVNEYFRISSEVESVISAGLRAQTQDEFLQAMERLASAKQFFEANSSISNASLMKLSSQLNYAINSCGGCCDSLIISVMSLLLSFSQ